MPNPCTNLEVHEWKITAQARYSKYVDLHTALAHQPTRPKILESNDTNVTLVFAKATAIRNCPQCRTHLIQKYDMPKEWWTDASRKSNGYFGCRVLAGHIATWTYFEMKQLKEGQAYDWYKLNIFIRWEKKTRRTIVFAFDTAKEVKDNLLGQLDVLSPDSLATPFWFYPHVVGEVARIQERAVWAIRDCIRQVETQEKAHGRPEPNYRQFNDIARHGIHVTETLDVAVETMQRMLVRHEGLLRQTVALGLKELEGQETHSQLQYYESFISSMRHRAIANDKRLANEIQLAFNTVAQHDANTSVKVAVIALIFLPPTFVSAIFSMTFFNFSPDSGWQMSSKFWLYWAVAVPITVATGFGWWYVQNYGLSHVLLFWEKICAMRVARKKQNTIYRRDVELARVGA